MKSMLNSVQAFITKHLKPGLILITLILSANGLLAQSNNYSDILAAVTGKATELTQYETPASDAGIGTPVASYNDTEPGVTSYLAGTSMTISRSASSICSGQSVTITWTYNLGDSPQGYAQYSTNGSTWYSCGASPYQLTFYPGVGTSYYYGRVVGNLGAVQYNATTISVTTNQTPGTTTVSGGGTYCGNVTLNATTVTTGGETQDIGTGTATSNLHPVYSYYNYSRSASLILRSEVASTRQIITHLAVYVGTSGSHAFTGIQIRLKKTTETTVPSTFPGNGTLVWSGNYTFSSTGWVTFDISDFVWDSDNLLIEWQHGYTSYTSNYPYFRYTAQSTNLQSYAYSDTSLPTTGNLTTSRVNYRFTWAPTIYWQNTTSNGTSTATPSRTQTVGSSGTYYFRARSSAGCWGAQGSASVTTSTQPSISISTTSATTVCSGANIPFTQSVSGGTGSITNQWQYSSNGSTWTNWTTTTNPTYSGITGNLYFRCVRSATGTNCVTATSNTIYITVVPDPYFTTQPTGGTVCSGGSRTLTVAAAGGTPSLTYQWQYYTGSAWTNISGATSTSYAAAPPSTRDYRCLVSASGNGCSTNVASNTATVTVVADPVAQTISESPTSGTSMCIGGTASATFSGGSGGTGTITDNYQYTLNGGSSWSTYTPGSTITSTTAGTNYMQIRTWRTATGNGCDNSAYNTVQYTIVADPSITSQPTGGTICTGGSINLSVTATGGTPSLTYQWYNSGGAISGATSSSYTATAASNYYCVVSASGGGCDNATSSTVTVTVVADPVAQTISATPTSGTTMCIGGTASATFSGGSGGTGTVTDNYQYTLNGGSSWSSYTPGSTITSTTAGTNYMQIRTWRTATGNGCDASGYNTAQYTIVADPSITTQPTSPATICAGGTSGNITIAASGGTGTTSYQWQYNNSGTWGSVSNGTPAGSTYTGGTSTTFSVAGISSAGSYQYRCVVYTSGSGCDQLTSSTATVTVVADPTVGTQPTSPATICAGGTSGNMTAAGSGGTGSFSYQWQYNNSGTWGSVSNGTPAGSTYTGGTSGTMSVAGISSAGTYQYRCIISQSGSGCGQLTSNTATVTVVADPTITTQPSSPATICAGGTSGNMTIAASGGTGTTTYQWQYNNSGTWGNVSNGTPAGSTYSGSTGTTFSVAGISSAGSYQYRCLVSTSGSGCDQLTSNTATVAVVADPTVGTQPTSPATICAGGTSGNMTAAGSGGTGSFSYQWQYNNSGTWGSVSNGTPAGSTYTGGTSGTMSVAGISSAGTYQYRCIISQTGSGCGQLTSNTATVTVVTDPSVTATGPASICSGNTADLTATPSNGTGSAGYQWQYYNGSSWVNVGASSSTYTTEELTTSTDYRCIYTASGSGCDQATSNTFTVVVDNPSISGLVTGDYLWTGNAGTEWNTVENWLEFDGSNFTVAVTVPTATNNVVFRSFGTSCISNNPAISSASGTCNDITIESGNTVVMANTQILNVSGNWKNEGTFTAGTGTVVFNGMSAQTIEAGSSAFNNVTFSNSTSGISDINIVEPMTINGSCTFTNGVVYFSGSGSLTFGSGASSNIGNANSYVNGVVTKTGTDAFTFALGEGTVWAPCAIAAPAGNSTITAEYKHEAPLLNWSASYTCDGSNLHHMSGVEYWLLTSTNSYPAVTLYWRNGTASGIADLPDLTVAHWNGNCWDNMGGTAVGNTSTGYITSSVAFSSYSPITFGTKTKDNPLPVELLYFRGNCNNNKVTLDWTTASEINNDYFEIERSSNGTDWTLVAEIDGAGNSNKEINYRHIDNYSVSGTVYYRLRQIDFDGTYSKYEIISINCNNNVNNPTVLLYPNPFNTNLQVNVENWDSDVLHIELYDMLGKKLNEWKFENVTGNYSQSLNMDNYAPAVYVIKINTANGVIVRKLEKK